MLTEFQVIFVNIANANQTLMLIRIEMRSIRYLWCLTACLCPSGRGGHLRLAFVRFFTPLVPFRAFPCRNRLGTS